jgi:hypothetical protein
MTLHRPRVGLELKVRPKFWVRNDYGYVSSVTPFPGDGEHFAGGWGGGGVSYLSPYLLPLSSESSFNASAA